MNYVYKDNDAEGVVLRIDNVLKPGTYDNFMAMMDVVNSRGAKVVIDVTPRWHGTTEHDPRYLEAIRAELSRGHVLALHGVEHRCRVIHEHEHKVSWMPTEDEFRCKDYHAKTGMDIPTQLQRGWLKEGNDLLEELVGQRTDMLMPPAHAYTDNTMTAMRAEGFRIISDYGRWDAKPYFRNWVLVLPFDFEDYMKNTDEDGSNAEAIFSMFRKYFDASVSQQGFFAMFTHVDFSGEGSASPGRLRALDRMICYAHDEGHSFVDPHIFLELEEGR